MTTPRVVLVLPDDAERLARMIGEAARREGIRWSCEHGHDVPFGIAACPTCGTRRFEVFRA